MVGGNFCSESVILIICQLNIEIELTEQTLAGRSKLIHRQKFKEEQKWFGSLEY